MMNNFIRIVQTPTKHGVGGSFNATASFEVDNIPIAFTNVLVKIDTGCPISMVPLAKFNVLKLSLNYLKNCDIQKGTKYILSYGVESSGKLHKKPITYKDKMNCEAMKFEHVITNFELDGMVINHDKIHVNYDRAGNILIGMDILENLDVHIGKNDTGETIFLACPKERINDDYLFELENTFHLGSSINAAVANRLC